MKRLATLAVPLLLGGCINLPALPPMPVVAVAAPAPACPAGQVPMRADRLYLSVPMPPGDGGPDTWGEFVATEIVPRFPDGLTMWPAQGQWKPGGSPNAHAMSWVIDVVHAPDARTEEAFAAVIEAYKRSFASLPVLRVSGDVCASS